MAGLSLAVIGGHGRADLAPIVAVRPGLFLFLIVALARWPARARVGTVIFGLAIAALGEGAWLAWHGAADVAGVLRMFGAGLALAALGEGLVRLARWVGGRWWRLLAVVLGIGLLLMPGAVPWFERLALGPPGLTSRADRPTLALLSGLPLAWDEAGVAGTLRTPPPAIMPLLAHNFTLQPIASAQADMLPADGLLLVVQPRIDAAGLVGIDAWVRGGGRALILTDSDLRWPTRLPPGDPGLPPDAAPLAPLLAHWGLRLDRDLGDPLAIREVDRGTVHFHVRPGAPGRLVSQDGGCAIAVGGLVADCTLGKGRALVLADADMLLDALWVGTGSDGQGRFRRTADNGPFIVALLDDLHGAIDRHADDRVAWVESSGPDSGWLIASGFPFVLLLGGFALRRRCANAALVTNSSHTYPQPANRHKGGTVADFRHDDR